MFRRRIVVIVKVFRYGDKILPGVGFGGFMSSKAPFIPEGTPSPYMGYCPDPSVVAPQQAA
jgi:hypothetical protein